MAKKKASLFGGVSMGSLTKVLKPACIMAGAASLLPAVCDAGNGGNDAGVVLQLTDEH